MNEKQDAADEERFSTQKLLSEEYVADMEFENNQQMGYRSEVASVQTIKQKNDRRESFEGA